MLRFLLKILAVSLLLVFVVVAGGYVWLARDRGPTHPALAAADMVPLIPLRDFWANQASEWGYSLSANGSYMSWWSVEGAATILNVQDRSTGDIQVIRPEDGQSADYEWSHDDRNLLLTHHKDDRWSVWRIDAADVDGEWVEVTPRGFSSWNTPLSAKGAG